MKKSFLVAILSLIALVCAAAFFAACDKGGEEQKEFTGFTVKESAEAEAGTEYVFETPAVLCEGNKVDLSVAVTFADKAVAHDGTKVYLENVGVYTITYTASYEGSTQSKSTALTSKDTTKPVIASKLPATLKMESALVLSENVSFKDKSGIKQAVFTVQDTTAETPAALQEGQFDAATTRLYITDETVKEVTVHISAEDNAGLKNERDVVIEIIPLAPYGSLTFGEAWYTASVLGGSNMPYEVTTKEDGAYTAITSTFKGSWPSFTVESESLKTLAAFDYITLRHKVTYGIPGGWLGLGKQEYTTTYTSTDGEWTLRTWYKDNRGKPSEPEAGDAIWADLAAGRLKILPTTGQNVETTFTLAEITGGFNDIVIDKGDSIDLIAKTGLAASEFTASFKAKGSDDTTPITDVTSFKPSSKGTILIAVDKEGFKETTLEIGITFTAEPAEYGNILNLNGYDAGDAYANVSGATATVIDDSVSGGKALKIVNSGGANTAAVMTISGDTVKTIASFDYFVIKARLLFEEASNVNVNLQVSNVSGRPSWGDFSAANEGTGEAYEWVFDKVTNSFTFTPETNSFTIKLQKWDSAVQTTIITAIEGGYYDIEEDRDTAIDLTEKLGLAANEFTASFRAEGEDETTTIENVTAFTPTEKGTILVTVNKDGFAETEFEIGFQFTLEPLPCGQLLFDEDFRRCTVSVVGGSGVQYEVTTNQDGEYTALTSTFTGSYPVFTLTSEALKAFTVFDTITLRYKVTYGSGSGWFGLEQNGYTTKDQKEEDGWLLYTWHRNDEYGKEGSGEAIWAALAAGELDIMPTTGQNVETTFILAEITGGYCDIEEHKGTSIDLTEKFGLAKNEFTASFRAEGQEDTTPIADAAAFVPEKEGTIVIEVLKEGFKEATFEIAFAFAPEPAKYGDILNLNGYDAGDAYANVSGATATVIDDSVSGGKALKIVNSGGANAAAVMTISGDTVKTIASFDYFVIKARLLMDSAATNTNVNLQVSNVTGRPSWGDYAAATSGDGTEYEWVFDKVTNSFDFDSTTNSFTVTFKKWDAAKLTVIVTEISGGYYDIETEEGQSVDLTEKFSLTAEEFSASFTPEGGEAQSVSNLTAFAPTQNGVLQLTVSKDGYTETQMLVNVRILTESYGTFGFADTSRYTLSAKNGTTTYDVTEITDGDYAAIKSEITGTYPKLTIQSEDLKALANFDYITVRYKVAYSASGGSLGLKGTQGDVYNGAASTTSDNGWTISTWRKDYVHPTNGNMIGNWIWDYIAQNGIVEININAWNGAQTVTTLTVAEITGGFDDIESDGAAINLAEKYGSGLVRAVYIPTDGEAQTLEGEALKTFAGNKSGTLQLVFAVNGYKTTVFDLAYTVTDAAE